MKLKKIRLQIFKIFKMAKLIQKKTKKRDQFLQNQQLCKFALNVKSLFSIMKALSPICIVKKKHFKSQFKASTIKKVHNCNRIRVMIKMPRIEKKRKKLKEEKKLLLSIEFTETVMQS